LQVCLKSLRGGMNPSCSIMREDARKRNRCLAVRRQGSCKAWRETVEGCTGAGLLNAGEIQLLEVDYVTIVGAN
jgi:hypothetical protein